MQLKRYRTRVSLKTQGKEVPECWLILFAQVLENKNLFQISG